MKHILSILFSLFYFALFGQVVPSADTVANVFSPSVLIQMSAGGNVHGANLKVTANTTFTFSGVTEGDQGYIYAEHLVDGSTYTWPGGSTVNGLPNHDTGSWDYIIWNYRGGQYYINIKPFAGFSLIDITDLSLYLDATASVYSDGGSTTALNGGTIQQWNDLSGNGNHATNSGTEKPTWDSTSINDNAGVDFNGNSFLQVAHDESLDIAAGASIFAVASSSGGAGTGERVLEKNRHNLGTSDNYWFTTFGGISVASGYADYTDAHTTGTNVFCGIWSASYFYNYFNSALRTDSEMNFANTDSLGVGYFRGKATPFIDKDSVLHIGSRDTIGGKSRLFFSGTINALLIIKRVVSDPERRAIEGALAWEFGIQSQLPNGHPFKHHYPHEYIYVPQWDRQFVSSTPYEFHYGSPDITKASNGNYIISIDEFGTGTLFDTSRVYTSSDLSNWTLSARKKGFWSSLFNRDDTTYLLGVDAQFGGIVISSSSDGGATWSANTFIRYGDGGPTGYDTRPTYHNAPLNILEYNGYYYKAFERLNGSTAPEDYEVFVIRAPTTTDLTDSTNWTQSNYLAWEAQWIDTIGLTGTDEEGFLEAQIIEDSLGNLKVLARAELSPINDKAILMDLDTGTMTLTFNQVLDLPGGKIKFFLIDDRDSSGYYVMLSNRNTTGVDDQRSVLSLHKSTNLTSWTFSGDLMNDDFYNDINRSVFRTGFQYPSAYVDGSDLLVVVRTSYARTDFLESSTPFHDSDRIVYKKISNFRNLLLE